MTRRHNGSAAAVGLAGLLLTACGAGSDDLRVGGVETAAPEPSASGPEDLTTAPEPSEAPTDEPTESSTVELLTPPDAELGVLDPAVVPAQGPGGGQGVVLYSITDVARPAPGELDPETRRDAVFVDFEVVALEGADQLVGWSPGSDLAGVTAEGAYLGAIAVPGYVAPCPRLEIPPGWTEEEPLTGCTIAQSPPRTPLVAVAYLGGGDAAPGPERVTWAVDVP
ncbi:hypothetical protein [Nocardioides nanhaiensis]|uniref:Uncharacterized protein n=1 Tax=Nocardioides nanhaiensis TaxID=1476871 RepID=A0ABP8VUM0_9ACTN